MSRSFDTVLIANRGEIAVRIARTLRERGLTSVAVFHPVDRESLHVLAADRAVELTADDPRAAYLGVEALIRAAKASGAGAIHPGYGFLSEQARFSRACEEAGVVFIGPRADTLATVGDKTSARAAARAAGLTVAPGWEGVPLDAKGRPTDEAIAAARSLGYPLLLKAVSGGGGKGMRVVRAAEALADGLLATAREAQASFGSAAVYLERQLEPVRHIEVQFVGDGAGNVAHLFERECSLQRRHQKVIEEAPGARVTAGLRAKLVESTKALASAVRYRGAGTAEFLVDAEGGTHFLEINARIQVEHPVTELVTGVDIVGLQLDVALGRGLPADLERAAPNGHAIEARLYAEDAMHDFLPQSGTIEALRLPSGPGVRVDTGVREGDEIGMHFDPMIAKISVWGPDRAAAVRRLGAALAATDVAGVVTNLPFLRLLATHPDFAGGDLSTSRIEHSIAPSWRSERKTRALPDAVLAAAAVAITEGARVRQGHGAGAESRDNQAVPPNPWDVLSGFRLGGNARGDS
ncbi:MAG: acetyl-CoA carboxylase biotin carboxylase subunit [Candidatus Eiseniibacteriota bacterium]